MHFYRILGLSVASEIEMPGLAGAGESTESCDVRVFCAPVPQMLENAVQIRPTWQMAGERFLLHIPGVGRFLLTGGREIAIEVASGAEHADVSIFLLGTVFGILMHQREHVVLHASAVHVNGKAMLFCGASGAGKSTLAAALGQKGYPLIADDVCAIDFGMEGPVVRSDGRLLKLWLKATEELGLAGLRGAPVRSRLEKFYVQPPQGALGDATPLGALYVLREARPPHAAGIERPNVVDATVMVRRNAYRPILVAGMGQQGRYFQAAASLANAGGIYHLTRPMQFKAMPEVIGWLESHWNSLGIASRAAVA